MNIAPVNSAITIKAINTEYKRIDRWCESTIKLSFLAATLFASIALVFHHFKSVDSMRLSFYLFGANIAIAVTTSLVSLYILNKRNKEYDAARSAEAGVLAEQKAYLEQRKGYYTHHSKADATQVKLNEARGKLYAAKEHYVQAQTLKLNQSEEIDEEELIDEKIKELDVKNENGFAAKKPREKRKEAIDALKLEGKMK